MIRLNVKTLIRAHCGDILSQHTVPDADLDVLIDESVASINLHLKAILHPFYVKECVFTWTPLGIVISTPPTVNPMTIINAYATDTNGNFYTLSVKTLPEVVQDLMTPSTTEGSIAIDPILMFNVKAPNNLQTLTVRCTIYDKPVLPLLDANQVDLPEEYLFWLSYLIKKKLYERYGIRANKEIDQVISNFESIINDI